MKSSTLTVHYRCIQKHIKIRKGSCRKDSIQCRRDYAETGSLKMRVEQNPPNYFFSISDVWVLNCAIMQLCAAELQWSNSHASKCLANLIERELKFLYEVTWQSMPGTHTQVNISARCKQGKRERLQAWLAGNIRGKHCSVQAHQKWRASETAVLDCRANKRQSFFDNVEFGKVYLETASCSLCVQVNRTLNTWMSVKTNCKICVGGFIIIILFS